MPCPVAVWSKNRRWCTFNTPTRELVGFCEDDFRHNRSLWLERIHPQDRAYFSAAWEKLHQKDGGMVSCQYRFFPKNRTQEICLSEVSFLARNDQSDSFAVWSLYGEDSTSKDELLGDQTIRELLRGLTHEIGNSLQTVSGELDLLRLAGALSSDDTSMIDHGLKQIRKVAHEIDAYLFPPPLHLKSEDPTLVLREVLHSSEKQLVDHGIRTSMVLRESLPELRLDWQFATALKEVIDFSGALLPEGGKLKIEARLRGVGETRYIEFTVINTSPVSLILEEKDVFRPFLKINDYRAGLSLALARQILRRHCATITFRKERPNQGIFSILIKVPPGSEEKMREERGL